MNTSIYSRPRFAWQWSASAVLSFILIGLAIAHLPTPHLGQSTPFHADLYAQCNPVPEVVFVGSSRTAFAVVPAAVDAALQRLLNRPVRSFNFGVRAANAVTYRLVIDGILRQDHRPRLVVIGLSPSDVVRQPGANLPKNEPVGVAGFGLPALWSEFRQSHLMNDLIFAFVVPGHDRWDPWQQLWLALRDGRPLADPDIRVRPDGWSELVNYPRDDQLWLRRDLDRVARTRQSELSPVACEAFAHTLTALHDAGVAAVVYEDPVPPCLVQAHRAGNYAQFHTWLSDETARQGAVLISDVFAEASDDDFIGGQHVAPWAVEAYSAILTKKIVKTGILVCHDGGFRLAADRRENDATSDKPDH